MRNNPILVQIQALRTAGLGIPAKIPVVVYDDPRDTADGDGDLDQQAAWVKEARQELAPLGAEVIRVPWDAELFELWRDHSAPPEVVTRTETEQRSAWAGLMADTKNLIVPLPKWFFGLCVKSAHPDKLATWATDALYLHLTDV